MKAYDIEIAPCPADRDAPGSHDGWCFGLPPGIETTRWPLDPANGWPLAHGFTLRLPEDHRSHGPEIVAVSFFASAFEHNDGGSIVKAPEIAAAMAAARVGGPEPSDPDLAAFWRSEKASHPRLHRFEDLIGTAFAAILLTRDEFDGPLRTPPLLGANRYRDLMPPPIWLTVGSAAAYRSVESYRWIGPPPSHDLAENRALRLTARANDPNAGRVPHDPYDIGPSDYVQPFQIIISAEGETDFRRHDWAENHAANHLGGTMQPSQWVPRFSPSYVEFEEEMGGFNFGGGNAQLDLRDMKFEWACG